MLGEEQNAEQGEGGWRVALWRGTATVLQRPAPPPGEVLTEGERKKVTEASQEDIWKRALQAGQGHSRSVLATCWVLVSTADVRAGPAAPFVSFQLQHKHSVGTH